MSAYCFYNPVAVYYDPNTDMIWVKDMIAKLSTYVTEQEGIHFKSSKELIYLGRF